MHALINRHDTNLDDILEGTVNLLPPAWQHPESTCARIVYRDGVYRTTNFMETAWCQSANILVSGKTVGTIEVYYLEEKPESHEGPFLREERDLIDALAERLGRTIERIRVERECARELSIA